MTAPRNHTLEIKDIDARIDARNNGYSSLAQAYIELIRPYRLDEQRAVTLFHELCALRRQRARMAQREYESGMLRKAS